jgi:hypothetical protein
MAHLQVSNQSPTTRQGGRLVVCSAISLLLSQYRSGVTSSVRLADAKGEVSFRGERG